MGEVEREPDRFTPGILLGLVITAAVLYVAQEVIMPLCLAVLLSFLLGTPVVYLQRHKLGRVPSVVIVVSFAFLVVAGLGWLVTTQMYDLAKKLPGYQQTIETKMKSFEMPGGGTFERFSKMLKSTSQRLKAQAPVRTGVGDEAKEPKPMPVEVHQPEPSPVQMAKGVLGPLLKPLGSAGIVIVFVVFMLLEREELRDRLIRLGGIGRMHLTTQAFDEAATRVSRYLFMQLIINLTYGIPVGIGLWIIGVPSPLLWGTFATLLRFIPYLGPWLAASFPVVLAFAVDPGWGMLLWTILLFLVMELISNNFVEPWLYGSTTGLSVVAILTAAVFWTWLWGPVGLFLSTPLTVCLVVLGRHVPQLAFLNILLGDQPVLTPESRFYQRLLAMDEDEAAEVAEDFSKNKPLVDVYDGLVLPALNQSELDRARGSLPEKRQKSILQGVRSLLDEFADSGDEQNEPSRSNLPDSVSVVCIPAKDEADEIAGIMLAQLLEPHGLRSVVLSATAATSQVLEQLDRHRPGVVCISCVPPSILRHARFVCRKIKDRFPQMKIVLGIWGTGTAPAESIRNVSACAPESVATSLREGVEKILPLAAPHEQKVPAGNGEHLSEHERAASLETPLEEIFDEVKRELAGAFNVPISLILLINTDSKFWNTQAAVPLELFDVNTNATQTSLASRVLAENETLIVQDISKDERFVEDPAAHERGIRFFSGTPLRTRTGQVVGAVCAVDTQPREISDEQRNILESVAASFIEKVQTRKEAVAAE